MQVKGAGFGLTMTTKAGIHTLQTNTVIGIEKMSRLIWNNIYVGP